MLFHSSILSRSGASGKLGAIHLFLSFAQLYNTLHLDSGAMGSPKLTKFKPRLPAKLTSVEATLDTHQLISMCFYTALVLIIPGPTNTLLFSSGISVGLARTLPLVLAEAAGYVISISVWGFSLLVFSVEHPWVLSVIKVACSSYLLLLAAKMWGRGRLEEDEHAKMVTRRNLFVATLLNPKAFLLASMAFPLQAFHDVNDGVVAFGAFLLVLVPIGIGWASIGRVTGILASRPRNITTLLRSASVLLVLFSGALLYSLVK